MAKQKDGRYRAKITVGTDASGKSIVKYVSGRTKKELEAAKAAAREKYVTDAARTAGDLQHYSRHVPYQNLAAKTPAFRHVECQLQ